MTDVELDLAARVAEQATYAAGTHLLTSRARLAETVVTRHDPVQVARAIAHEATELMRGVVARAYVQHDFCASDESPRWRIGRPCWVADALDGQADYLRGAGAYAVTLALVIDGEPLLGAVYDPQHDEFFGALRGRGAVLNGAPIRCGDELARTPRPARMAAVLPRSDSPGMAGCIAEVGRVATGLGTVRRSVSKALEMAHLAAGRIDGFWAHELGHRHTAAGIVLMRESGALVEARDAAPLLESRSLFACAPALRERFLSLLGPGAAVPAMGLMTKR